MGIEYLFKNSALHDYKVEKIEIDYPKGSIILQFIDLKNKNIKIQINKFYLIEFTNYEEWGKGTYVVSSDIISKNGIYDIEIQLNSGDKCNIKCNV